MIFGLCLVPLVGITGVAVDYGRAIKAKATLQKLADETALMAVLANHDGRAFDPEAAFRNLLAQAQGASDMTAEGAKPSLKGTWLSDDEFRLEVSSTLRTTLAAVLQSSMGVGVVAQAVGVQTVTASEITGTNLAPEAADYNEIQAYCYDARTKQRLGPIDAETGLRTAFPKIADNTNEGVKAKPNGLNIRCGGTEQISYVVKNIRGARTSTTMQRTGTPRLFYTDAVMDEKTKAVGYTVTYDGVVRNTLETILCDKEKDCTTVSQGGTMPDAQKKNRSPSVNTKVCAPGKYLYFGWEDRIPGYEKNGLKDDSDSDFDDIRLVVTCPTVTRGPFRVRLSA